MPRRNCASWHRLRGTNWRRCEATARDSIRFALTINGESVSSGERGIVMRWKSLISLTKGEGEDGQIRTFDGAGAPGGDPAGGFHEAAGIVGEQVGAGAACSGDAHWRNRARAAADHSG